MPTSYHLLPNRSTSKTPDPFSSSNGGTAGTGYSQTQVNGTVSLGGAALVLTGSGEGSSNSPIILIQSTGGVSGTFAGLSQGATVSYQGRTYHISYNYNPNGGTGTDVALVPV